MKYAADTLRFLASAAGVLRRARGSVRRARRSAPAATFQGINSIITHFAALASELRAKSFIVAESIEIILSSRQPRNSEMRNL